MKITIKTSCCLFVITLFFCSNSFAQANDSNNGKLITKDATKRNKEKFYENLL
jgi:hypothetical protein